MSNDDDFGEESPLQKHLETLSLRIETIVKTRLQGYNEQLNAFTRDLQIIAQQVEELQVLVNYKISADLFLSKELGLMKEELELLETYMGIKDPKMKEMLQSAREKQRRALEIRKLTHDG